MHLRVCLPPSVWVYLPASSTPPAKATSFHMSDLFLSFAAGQIVKPGEARRARER